MRNLKKWKLQFLCPEVSCQNHTSLLQSKKINCFQSVNGFIKPKMSPWLSKFVMKVPGHTMLACCCYCWVVLRYLLFLKILENVFLLLSLLLSFTEVFSLSQNSKKRFLLLSFENARPHHACLLLLLLSCTEVSSLSQNSKKCFFAFILWKCQATPCLLVVVIDLQFA